MQSSPLFAEELRVTLWDACCMVWLSKYPFSTQKDRAEDVCAPAPPPRARLSPRSSYRWSDHELSNASGWGCQEGEESSSETRTGSIAMKPQEGRTGKPLTSAPLCSNPVQSCAPLEVPPSPAPRTQSCPRFPVQHTPAFYFWAGPLQGASPCAQSDEQEGSVPTDRSPVPSADAFLLQAAARCCAM